MYRDANALTRARLLAFDDSGEFQTADFRGFAGETFTKVHRIQPHGFSSHPPSDAVGLMLRLGESDRALALGFEKAGRPRSLPQGGSVLYDDSGNVVFARMSNGIQVKATQGGVTIETPQSSIAIDGSSGDITAQRGGMLWRMSSSRIDLGGLGGARVITESGPSSKVYAVL